MKIRVVLIFMFIILAVYTKFLREFSEKFSNIKQN